MEKWRKYGPWVFLIAVALPVIARTIWILYPPDDPSLPHLRFPVRDSQSILQDQLAESFLSSWRKKENGTADDTVFIPYYDSLARNAENPFIASAARKESESLRMILKRRDALRLLPGEWKLVCRDSFSMFTGKTGPELEIQAPVSKLPAGMHRYYPVRFRGDSLFFMIAGDTVNAYEKYIRVN